MLAFAQAQNGLQQNSIYKVFSNRSTSVLLLVIVEQGGSVPEWLMGADCKSAGYAYAGSNPARPIPQVARVAQW